MTLSFLTPMLLAGAALVAVPILIHLIMRRKPKHLIFPAFRFLRQKQRTTVQKLRLRHLLLLALRVLLILAAVFALARPELSGGPHQISTESALGVVLVFDTSASMGYIHNDKSRLDEAKEQAEKFLKQLPDNSKIAVFETGAAGAQLNEPLEAINRIRALSVQPYNRPVTDSLREAIQFLERERASRAKDPDGPQSLIDLPLILCIVSDRTEASWNAAAAREMIPSMRELEGKLGITLKWLYLDMSPEKPRNLSITGLSVRQVQGDVTRETPIDKLEYGVAKDQPVQIQAHVRVTGMKLTGAKLILYVNGNEHDSQTLQMEVSPGENKVATVTFSKALTPKEPHYQGEVRLQVNDALKIDDVRYWTLSAPQRSILLVVDKEGDAFYWHKALEAQSTVKLMPMAIKTVTLDHFPTNLSPEEYQAVVLINVENPGDERWNKLSEYVNRGGGLIVLPGENTKAEAYRTDAAMQVMPAKLKAIKDLVKSVSFDPIKSDHDIVNQFRKWEVPLGSKQVRAWRIWELEPLDKTIAEVVVPFDAEDRSAMLERHFTEGQGHGKVLLFTTAMYARSERDLPPKTQWKEWNNFLQSPIYLSLVYASTRYVLGAREERQNYELKDVLRFAVPRLVPRIDSYILSGPDGVSENLDEDVRDLLLTAGRLPGNYKLSEPAGNKSRPLWNRYFSVNLASAETQLVDPRPSVEIIEEVLGEKAFAPLEEAGRFRDVAKTRLGQTPRMDLLPYLMLAALLILIVEGLLANRFYKQAPQEEETPAASAQS